MIGVILMPSFFTHFVVTFTRSKNNKFFLFITYLVSLALAATVYSSLWAKRGGPFFAFPYWLLPGRLFPVHLTHFLINLIYSYFLIFRSLKDSKGLFRQQIRYVLLGTVIGFLGGLTNYFYWYRINIPPIFNISASLGVPIITYAIVRHHLMDIEVVIKRTLVFAGTFAFIFGVFVTMSVLISEFFGGGRIPSLVISAIFITIGLRPIEAWLINVTNKYLFQKKHDYKEIIQTFIDQVATVLDLDKVINSTLDLLSKTIYPETAGIFLYNKAEDRYEVYSSFGIDNKEIILDDENKLIQYLKNYKEIALMKQIDGYIGVDPDVQKQMRQLNATICLPFILHNDLIGFISLGKKKSDQEYSKDDLDVLRALARTETISIANSQLLTEAAQAERRAAIGTMAAGIHHEVGNPLNIINTKIQLFLLSKQKGLFSDKSKEEVASDCENILNETIKQTNRISEITKKLASFAKPEKEIKPELVSIPEQIEETLAVVGHELELERIIIEKHINDGLPQILADKRQIQQVLFNLIKNAGQAIEGAGKIIIKALELNNRVHIEIIDTGKGIPQDKLHRIFEPFFSTKATKGGTGLGLSIVRQLVWRNKGEISVSSEVGKGTTFIIEFPRAG